MSERGNPPRLGARCADDGVHFSVYAGPAERVELCFFADDGTPQQRLDLPDWDDGVWHGFVADCGPGQLYGYRVHGPYRPKDGPRCDPSKLLLDPYAREIRGGLTWHESLFTRGTPGRATATGDSAPYVPKSVVTGPRHPARPFAGVPWGETVLYEAHARGYTMRHPHVPQADRGRFAGLKNRQVLAYLKALGITTIDLLPVQYFVDESFLVERGLRNYWGYNSLGFFAPMPRYAGHDPVGEFVDMVNTLHDAGFEVVLDVVYNHTAEGDGQGPTLSFRGLDNAAYYRLVPGDKRHYINDTGCGNTINMDHPRVQQMVLDSLRYWAGELGVDGFRFDLAPVLARRADGFHRQHSFFEAIANDPILRSRKMIAEPWDVGPGGYQLGHFPAPWAEWNDQYRDAVRRFWRGDRNGATFAQRLHGSSDIFEASGRPPWASINKIAAHDGYTTRDVVTYERKHNEANGENNRDGHNHNYSRNWGVEGETDDPAINALRRRQRLNLIATLMFSQGTPMLLAGDEFGHTQRGNNNAYAQDNETAWLDWGELARDPAFAATVRQLVQLRRELPLLRQPVYLHGRKKTPQGQPNIEWLRPGGDVLSGDEWHHAAAFALILRHTGPLVHEVPAVTLLFNATETATVFRLPEIAADGRWRRRFDSGAEAGLTPAGDPTLIAWSCACWAFRRAERIEPEAAADD